MVVQALLAVVVLWSAYFKGYANKKGENLATHEDIEKPEDQVAVVTKTAKEIETKISNEAWDRQKRWELKRDVLFDTVKRISEVDEALLRLNTKVLFEEQPTNAAWLKFATERKEQWTKARIRFSETKELVRVVCGREIGDSLETFLVFADQIAIRMIRDKDAAIYQNSQIELAGRLLATRVAMRKELGIDDGAS